MYILGNLHLAISRMEVYVTQSKAAEQLNGPCGEIDLSTTVCSCFQGQEGTFNLNF